MKKSKKVKVVKKKKIIGILLAIILLIFIAFLVYNKLIKNESTEFSAELLRSQSYDQVEDGDEAIDGVDNVTFDAFFLKDVDSDGVADSIRGTCNEIGSSGTLFMELDIIEEGYVKDGLITINANNFYFKTAIIADDEIPQNYISSNTTEIEFNDISNGTQKLILGYVRSGDYSSTSTQADAIGNNTNNYSNSENYIKFTGTYVDAEGEETEFTKTVYFTVDWYGEVDVSASIELNTSRTIYDETNLETYLTDDGIVLTYDLYVKETLDELIMYGSYVYGTVPDFNGYGATDLKITGTGVNYEFDVDTQEFLGYREAAVRSSTGEVTYNAYEGTYKTTTRYVHFSFTITYPLEAYETLEEPGYMKWQPVVNVVNKGFNNPNTEDGFENPYVSEELTVTITRSLRWGSGAWDVRVWNGTYDNDLYNQYIISKQKPLTIYNGSTDEAEDDTYLVRWCIYTASSAKDTGGIVLEETNEDKWRDSSSNYTSMEGYTSFVGVYFTGATDMLGEDGWIKVYDDDTEVLLATFTSDDWDTYTSSNPYYYDNSVGHIRVETSSTTSSATFKVYNIKEIDDELVTQDFTKDEFDDFIYIYSYVTGYMVDPDDTSEVLYGPDTDVNIAAYVATQSIAEISITEDTISTQETAENEIITITTDTTYSNTKGWVNGEFLVKMPEGVMLMEINSITIDNENVEIATYSLYEEDDCYFIKILTENEDEEVYTITIDCDITPDPRITNTTDAVTLYAIDETAGEYYFSEEDIYDVDEDSNLTEYVNCTSDEFILQAGNTLSTLQMGTIDGNEDEIIVAPKVLEVDKLQRTANITISLLNNYTYDVSDITILGIIPREGNVSPLTGNDLSSSYSTYITGEIEIEEELEEYVTIYYSTNYTPTTDLDDEENGWITADEVTNWDEIVTFLIVIDDSYILESGATVSFTYEISIPEGISYNEVSYASYGVYYALNTTEGLYYTQTSAQKLGVMIAKQYDLEIIKYQEDTEKTLEGIRFILTEDGAESSSIARTNEDGVITFSGLYVERYYTLQEYSTTDDYILNGEEIRFYTYIEEDDDGNSVLYIVYVDDDGNYLSIEEVYTWVRDTYVTDANSETEEDYKITLEIDNEVLAHLRIYKVDEDGNALSNVKFILSNGSQSKIYTTDTNGMIEISGIYVDTQYTLTETKATGYYIPENSITFTLSKSDGTFEINELTNNDTIIDYELITEDYIPVLTLTIEDEEIPTYNLEIVKYAKDSDTVLEGAQFKISGDGLSSNGETYRTDENGLISIEGLYEYVDGKTITGEYSLTETYSPDGYALDSTTLSFVVYREDGDLVFNILDGSNVIRTITSDDGNEEQDITIDQDTDTITIGIENEEIFTLTKIDGDTGEVIEGAKFKILDTDGNYVTGSDGEIVGTLETIDGEEMYVVTTDELGETTANLAEGLYMAIEVYVPEGYDLAEDEADRTYYFGIGESKEAETSWIKIQGEGWESMNSIIDTSGGGIIGVGVISSYNDSTGTDVNNDGSDEVSSIGDDDGLIVNYDSDGNYEWAYTLGGEGDEEINKVSETSDGGYVIVGYTSSYYVYYGGSYISELSISMDDKNFGQNDGILIKLNSAGIYEWGVRIGGTYDDEITSVVEDSNGNIDITGTYYSDTFNFYNADDLSNLQDYITKTATDTSKMNGFVASYTAEGNYNWSQNISGSYDVEVVDITETSAGIAIAVNHISTVYLNTSKSTSEGGASTSYVNGTVVGYDLDGNYSWRYRFYPSSASYNVEIGALKKGMNDEVYVAVNHAYTLYGVQNADETDTIYSSTTDYFAGTVVELTSTGEYTDTIYTLDGNYDDYISSIDISTDGDIAISGWFYSTEAVDVDGDDSTQGNYDFNAVTGSYTSDGFLMTINTTGTVLYSSQYYGDGYDLINSVVYLDEEVITAGTTTSTELYATNIGSEESQLTNEGNWDGFITYGVITAAEIAESSTITVSNYLKEFTITTEVITHDEDGVEVEGGSITGSTGIYNGKRYKKGDTLYVETVQYNKDGTIDIVITPDEGYAIVEITINGETYSGYTVSDDGTVTISAFTSVTQDYHVTVEFSSTVGYVEVNHYLWTEDEGCTETAVAEGVTNTGEDGEEYTTEPETDIEYEIITNSEYYGDDLPDGVDGDGYYIPDNYAGTYSAGEIITVNYYYKAKTYTLTVHYYIEGTETQVPLKDGTGTVEDVVTEGYYYGDEYNTSQADEDTINYNIYKLIETPADATGTIEGNTVVTYYYQLITIDLTITKVSQTDSTVTLSGAEFTLFKLICEDSSHKHDTDDDLIDAEDYDETCWELVGTYTTDENGILSLEDLEITGIYRLVETATSDNSYLLPSGQWKIEFDYGNLTDDVVVDYNGQGIKITAIGNPPALSLQTVSNDEEETDILYLYNEQSYDIPITGGIENSKLYAIGISMLLLGIFVMAIRKHIQKKS